MNYRRIFTLPLLLLLLCVAVFAQPASPQPDPNAPNVFYGDVPPGGENAPVLVFIHGLGGNAYYFFTGHNDMYTVAYAGGYRTAFISMSPDNSANTAPVAENAAVINTTLPYVLAHYGVSRIYFVGHSKGGIDTQFAMAYYPAVLHATKAVFTLSTPNQGDALADWCFGVGKVACRLLNLFNPGMADLRTATVQAYRSRFDPVFEIAGIPFYTLGGDDYSGNLATAITGPVLKQLTGEDNDGLVTPSESRLSPAFSSEMAVVPNNHYRIGTGSVSFAFIQARVPIE